MKTRKQQAKRKRILTVIVIIIIAALAFAYVLPLTGMAAEETPPPEDDQGTDFDYDDSTLPAPWENPEEKDETPPPKLMIMSKNVRLDVGAQMQLDFVMENIPGDVIPEWESRNNNVAVVGADGTVKAVAPGSAEIIVRAGGLASSVLVSVNNLKAGRVNIVVSEEIARTGNKSYELKVGDVTRLTAKIEPVGAKVDLITWKIGNKEVASLSHGKGQYSEFVADAVGRTQVTVTADSVTDSITINIVESGVSVNQIWEYIKIGVVIVVGIVVLAVVLTYISQKRKKEKERQKALAAKRRREEAERRERERERERKKAEAGMQRVKAEPRPTQRGERSTLKISGTAVGAGISAPKDMTEGPERPLTLDDLD